MQQYTIKLRFISISPIFLSLSNPLVLLNGLLKSRKADNTRKATILCIRSFQKVLCIDIKRFYTIYCENLLPLNLGNKKFRWVDKKSARRKKNINNWKAKIRKRKTFSEITAIGSSYKWCSFDWKIILPVKKLFVRLVESLPATLLLILTRIKTTTQCCYSR